MNRSEIRDAMRMLLNEDAPGFWSNADLDKCINMACQKVNTIASSVKEDYFTQSAIFSSIASQKSYSLPFDCRSIRRMEIYDLGDPSKVYKIDETRFPRTEAMGAWPYPITGRPSAYYVIGTHFDLMPIPDDVYPMRIYYDVRKNDMALDSESPSIPTDFHDAIVFWGCVLASTVDGNPQQDNIATYQGLFKERKEEFIQHLLRRAGDDGKSIEGYLEGIL